MNFIMDLDGTICETTSGGNAYFTAHPKQDVINRMRALKSEGHSITIYTARGMNLFSNNVQRIEREYRQRTEWWLRDWQVPYDQLLFGKPAGDIYVDDKGMTPNEFATHNF